MKYPKFEHVFCNNEKEFILVIDHNLRFDPERYFSIMHGMQYKFPFVFRETSDAYLEVIGWLPKYEHE